MKPKITKRTHEIDGKKRAYYIVSHEFHDRNWDVYYSWDILVYADKCHTILAIWDSKSLVWISPDAFVWEGALELVQHVHNLMNQPAD